MRGAKTFDRIILLVPLLLVIFAVTAAHLICLLLG
jgi:hypothetical protein